MSNKPSNASSNRSTDRLPSYVVVYEPYWIEDTLISLATIASYPFLQSQLMFAYCYRLTILFICNYVDIVLW